MSMSIMTPTGLAAALAAGAAFGVPTAAQTNEPVDAGLAAETLADGESVRAIAMLRSELEKHPGDPALLINLGIAYAQAGSEAEARNAFEAALSSRDVVELETSSGSTTDSRRLARRALSMLDRGAFRSDSRRTDQVSMRDQ